MADEIASGSGFGLSIIEEDTFNVTPANPEFEPYRYLGLSPTNGRALIVSQELNINRQITGGRLGNSAGTGTVDSELSFASFDDIIEASLCSIRQNIRAITISALDTDDSFNDSASNLPIFAVGDTFEVSGFTTGANNGTFTVLTSTASKLVTDSGVLTAEVAGDDVRIVSTEVKAGVARRSFTIEGFLSDLAIPEYHRYTGCEFSMLSFSVTPDKIIDMKADFIYAGEAKDTAIISGATYKTASLTKPFVNFDGAITEGGGALGTVTSLEFKIDNNHARNHVVTSSDPIKSSIGRSNVTGSMTVFFDSKALLDKFNNETESSIVFALTDVDGNVKTFNIPRIQYSVGDNPQVSGEGSVTATLQFQAYLDATEASNIVISRVNA